MNKKREQLLQNLVTDWLWMQENELGRGLIGHYGYMGNAVVWKINDNGVCEFMDFYEFYRDALTEMLNSYRYDVWQSNEFLYFIDRSEE